MYDSHAHLDLLCQKLGYLSDVRDFSRINLQEEKDKIDYTRLKKMILSHTIMLHPTISSDNFRLCYELFSELPNVNFLVGSHPEIVDKEFDLSEYLFDQQQLFSDIKDGKYNEDRICGVGECGLDYYYTQDNAIIEKQKALFRSQIEVAIAHDLPLIIHCRDAFVDIFKILDEYPPIYGNFWIHCFTGGVNEMQEVIQRGGSIALGGIVTFKSNREVQEVASICPIENILIETDLPFLSPVPKRGEICLPEFIQYTADKIASLKNMSTDIVWSTTANNLFRLTAKNRGRYISSPA